MRPYLGVLPLVLRALRKKSYYKQKINQSYKKKVSECTQDNVCVSMCIIMFMKNMKLIII
jgi:hypothetical protein